MHPVGFRLSSRVKFVMVVNGIAGFTFTFTFCVAEK